MTTIDDVRALASELPRSYEALVRDRVRFRVGQLVYLAFSRDEKVMGFAFPKEERERARSIRAGQVPDAPPVGAPIQLGAGTSRLARSCGDA